VAISRQISEGTADILSREGLVTPGDASSFQFQVDQERTTFRTRSVDLLSASSIAAQKGTISRDEHALLKDEFIGRRPFSRGILQKIDPKNYKSRWYISKGERTYVRREDTAAARALKYADVDFHLFAPEATSD
jgi:hypothetical protein